MTSTAPQTQLQLRSLIRSSGQLELSLVEIPVPRPQPGEVLIRIEAAPLNPSDLGLLFGAADMATATAAGSDSRPVITATVPPKAMPAMAGRLDQSMPVGNEGAGMVVATGDSTEARALAGRRVAVMAGAMYSQYRCVPAVDCLVLPEGVTSAQGASAFVNPLTTLAMLETMRAEGHKALVHTAAASNLGQMLVRLCAKDGVELVNIVRSRDQETLLRALGARHVCNSTSEQFKDELTDAVAATGATLGFDATGGGTLGADILSAMERAVLRSAASYSRYGSAVHKQVYLYGSLDSGPTTIVRDFGMSWGMGGWLVMTVLQRLGAEAIGRLKRRVADELTTTFSSAYTREIALADMLRLDAIDVYRRRETGGKFLLTPNPPGPR
jgi:NADPH2:quinone reductase